MRFPKIANTLLRKAVAKIALVLCLQSKVFAYLATENYLPVLSELAAHMDVLRSYRKTDKLIHFINCSTL